jgi:sporulation protein YlmC with PRC-barrel domain
VPYDHGHFRVARSRPDEPDARAGVAGSPAGPNGADGASRHLGSILTSQEPDQWRVSKLDGVDIYSPENEKIGDVSEVLLDRNGKAQAVVVGIGGFLGIGQKNVAIPFDAVEWTNTNQDVATTSATGTSPGIYGTGDTAPSATGSTTAGNQPSGTAGNTRPSAGATAGSGDQHSHPQRGILRMSKADLQNAPEFRYTGETPRENTGASGSGAGTSGSTAPRQ